MELVPIEMRRLVFGSKSGGFAPIINELGEDELFGGMNLGHIDLKLI